MLDRDKDRELVITSSNRGTDNKNPGQEIVSFKFKHLSLFRSATDLHKLDNLHHSWIRTELIVELKLSVQFRGWKLVCWSSRAANSESEWNLQ